jgi:hypothetical protein
VATQVVVGLGAAVVAVVVVGALVVVVAAVVVVVVVAVAVVAAVAGSVVVSGAVGFVTVLDAEGEPPHALRTAAIASIARSALGRIQR